MHLIRLTGQLGSLRLLAVNGTVDNFVFMPDSNVVMNCTRSTTSSYGDEQDVKPIPRICMLGKLGSLRLLAVNVTVDNFVFMPDGNVVMERNDITTS